MDPKAIKEIVQVIYEARRDRRVNPKGRFDRAGRWYPNTEEDCDGDGSCVRGPSRAYPYSYMTRCRTKAHVKALVLAGLAGKPVPCDVHAALRAYEARLICSCAQARLVAWDAWLGEGGECPCLAAGRKPSTSLQCPAACPRLRVRPDATTRPAPSAEYVAQEGR